MVYNPNPKMTLRDWLLRLDPKSNSAYGYMLTKQISEETFKAIYDKFFADEVVSQKID